MEISTIRDILELSPEDMLDMGANDLLDATRKAVKFANDRQRRAREAIAKQQGKNPEFPVPQTYSEPRSYYKNIMDAEGKTFLPPQLDKDGKLNINILRGQFTRLKHFLSLESSTYKGWYNIVTRGIKNILQITNIRVPRKDYAKFFRVYRQLNERVNEMTVEGGKYELWRRIAEYSKEVDFAGKSVDDIVGILEDRIREDDPEQFDPEADISKF